MRRSALAAVVATAGALAAAAPAAADLDRPWFSVSDNGAAAPTDGRSGDRSQFSREDPPSEASGLPAAQEHIELVSELNPQHFGGVRIGEIADLAVHKGYAYLNSWAAAQCDRGGVYVIDIRDVKAPKEVAYIPPIQPFYHGEGAHAISVDVPGFKGDILAVNNETWGSNVANTCGPADRTRGGFDLYDVTDPTNPKVLVQAAGDRDNGTPDNPADDLPTGNSYHSVFIWQAGPRAYLVASDNTELKDVDIWDITDPEAPEQVADIQLSALFPQILDGERANGNRVFNHDMIVKRIDGRFIMSVSNWDSGYVQIDVTDPANPTYVTDTTTVDDPFRPSLFAEGNAHQSEFSADDQFLLGADEDFAPFRAVLTGAATGKARTAIEGGDNPKRIIDLPDETLDGTTVWAGDGCEGAAFDSTAAGDPEFPTAPPDDGDPDTDRIALVERGGSTTTPSSNPAATPVGCGFAEKIDNAAAAGFDGVVIFNQVRPDDGQVNMNTTGVQDTAPATIPAVQMRRVDALGADGAIAVNPGAFGTTGPDVSIGTTFDGWGDTHLYDAKTSELIDSYAVPESQDPRFASGFGDLTVHEFATDPTEPIAYAAWYGAGVRTFRFSRAEGLVPTGKWIDDDGNGSNVWGVEVFTGTDGERYFATSDRDFGLQIFRYTGVGAAARPTCSATSARGITGRAIEVPLTCTDANGNTLTRSIASAPASGTLGAPSGGSVVYTSNAGFTGTDSFTFRASDGSLTSEPATATVTVQTESDYYNIPPGGEKPDNTFSFTIGKFAGNRLPVRPRVKANGRVNAVLRIRVRKGKRKPRFVRVGGVTASLTKGAGRYRVVIRVAKKAKRRLVRQARRKGRVNARVRVRWTPTGGTARTLEKKKKLPALRG